MIMRFRTYSFLFTALLEGPNFENKHVTVAWKVPFSICRNVLQRNEEEGVLPTHALLNISKYKTRYF